MHNRWQLLVVMALALSAFNFHNNSAAEQPATTTTTTTTSQPPTATAPTTTTTTTNPPGEQDQSGEGRDGQPGPEQGPADQASSHRVVLGDNLWTIARDYLAEIRGRRTAELPDREIAAYWLKVITVNRARLKSGDPDLIYAGERIGLPSVAAAPAQPAPETQEPASHVVVAGDNLWRIARDTLSEARGGAGEPTNREVAAYWRRVVETNRDRLVSGDPDLIYPREEIVLPPVD